MAPPLIQDFFRRALSKSGSGLVLLPRGETLLDEPLISTSLSGFTVQGISMHDSVIRVDYGTEYGVTPFSFLNSRDTCFRDLKIGLHTKVAAVIEYARSASISGTPTNNHHRNMAVIGNGEGRGGHAAAAIRFRAVEKDSPNNEAGYSHNVHVSDCDIGWKIEGSQSKEHVMDHCRIQGGRYAVDSSGSFWWRGGGGSGLSDAAFRLREPVDSIRIDYAAFEASRRLLHASGPAGYTGDGQPIRICGGRFMCDQLHEDGAAVILESQGPLTIESYVFGSGTQRAPHIRANSPSQVTLRDVEFASWGAFSTGYGTDGSDPVRFMDSGIPRDVEFGHHNVWARDVKGTRRRVY